MHKKPTSNSIAHYSDGSGLEDGRCGYAAVTQTDAERTRQTEECRSLHREEQGGLRCRALQRVRFSDTFCRREKSPARILHDLVWRGPLHDAGAAVRVWQGVRLDASSSQPQRSNHIQERSASSQSRPFNPCQPPPAMTAAETSAAPPAAAKSKRKRSGPTSPAQKPTKHAREISPPLPNAFEACRAERRTGCNAPNTPTPPAMRLRRKRDGRRLRERSAGGPRAALRHSQPGRASRPGPKWLGAVV
ncbi:hypothetical protein FN846DRAFT_245318 [Sphaerosporella brunnea]|uniref:Uncharacterized protein n=1 Tax=Sphaerosporella brunnea TaxID=1250544 RepID=A0A5J5FCQ9_9PEZI|nr:hypothetical protein FN846DRAFT_245318 [Sphaerosporella brunnea]